MFTPDERADTMKQIQNAYQTLELYENMKKEGEDATSFAETAFSLNAYAIASIAKTFGFDSKVKKELDEKSRETKERHQKIQDLEDQLAAEISPTTYKENVQKAFKKIESIWNDQGFTGTYKPSIHQYGNVYLSFQLQPFHEMWDMWTEEVEEEKLRELFQARQRSFYEKGLDVIHDSSYVYVVDNDENKRKIQAMLTQIFPTLEIEKWDARKHGNIFTLSHVEISIKSLQFLEGTV